MELAAMKTGSFDPVADSNLAVFKRGRRTVRKRVAAGAVVGEAPTSAGVTQRAGTVQEG